MQPQRNDDGGDADGRARLSPWPVRVAVYVVLVVIALGAIWVIDRHVMALHQNGAAGARQSDSTAP